MSKQSLKRAMSFFLALVTLFSVVCTTAYAGELDENGDTGGSGPGGNGSFVELWSGSWSGMRITVIDITDPAREIDGEQWGKVASGTVSVDITGLSTSDSFFTRTLAGDGSTPLAYGSQVTHFGKVSKMAYRDGAAVAMTTGSYTFRTVAGCPAIMGSSKASAQTIKNFINNQAMLTNIAAWCGGGLTYDSLISGQYKLLVEPIMYCLIEENKYAFTAHEAALYKPHGNSTGYTLINNTLANCFFLEHDELGWDAWTGATNVKQQWSDITSYLGMHIYSIAPEILTKTVKITKKSDTGESLSGAQFTVVGNGKNETVTVNGTLSLDVSEWPIGEYTVTETIAPTGYDLDATPKTFTISATNVTPAELTFTNKKTPPKSLKILKKSDTGGALNGAKFTITGNGKDETVTVNGSLTLNLDGWPEGTYTVTETTAPSGYDLDAAPQTFAVSASGVSPAELTFINTFTPPPPVEVKMKKVEYGTDIGLGGAIFQLTQLSHWERHLVDPDGNDTGEFYDDDNGDALNAGDPGYHHNVEDLADDIWDWFEIRQTEVVGTFVSGEDGSIPVGALEAGSYVIEEIVPPAGYALQENIHERIQTFDIPREGGYEVGIVFANKKLPGLTILKVDEATGEPLAGAEFSVKHNGNIVYEGLTDASGVINLDGLPEGWYSVTELAAPDGYLIRDEHKDVFLSAGGSAQVKFDNRRKPTLEILKVDAQTKQPLSGATFRVWKTEGGTVGEYTTGADGKVTIPNLEDTIYSIEEITAPNGYLLDPQHKDVQLEWGKVTQVVFTDRKKPGLTITKVDEQTGDALAGAEFSVAHKGGAIIYEGQTDGNGKINLTDLAEGWYTVTETAAPYGYLIVNKATDVFLEGDSVVDVRFMNRRRPTLEIIKIDEQTKQPLQGAKFKVWATEGDTVGEYVTDADGRILIPNLDDKIYSVEEIIAPDGYVLKPQTKQILLEWGKVNTLTFTNLKKPTLTIIKYDELTNEPLAGASFRLWKTEGETWSETMVTDANGRITWTGLDPGIYSIQEIDEPYGYFKDESRKEILLNGGENKFLEFFNRPRPVLTILKRDQVTGEPLAGVKFKVQRLEGETIGEFITDENGIIELSPKTGYLLDEKIYRVTEVQPPNEYLLDANPTKDVLLKWYEPTELVFENLLKPTLIFIKRDGMSGRGISDATYRVQYESPTGGVTTLGSYKTKCGLIVLPYVTPGWYVLTETLPAPGYSLPTNPTQRFYLAPGENSYTYAQTHEDLYVDQRTNPNNGKQGTCGDWCGYLCSVMCANNCGNPGGGSMDGGTGGGFGDLTITNGNGDPITGGTTGGNNGGTTPNPSKPTLTAGTVTRVSDLSATIQFSSSAEGRYYYSVVNSGANEPAVGTGGLGTVCAAGSNTITVYMTAGAKDVYIKVKDANGNVSDSLKITIPAYSKSTQTPTTEEPPNFDDIVITGGTVVYLNPDFSTVVIKFGSY